MSDRLVDVEAVVEEEESGCRCCCCCCEEEGGGGLDGGEDDKSNRARFEESRSEDRMGRFTPKAALDADADDASTATPATPSARRMASSCFLSNTSVGS